MLDNLMKHYKNAMTTTYIPHDTTYDWFQTDAGQVFGISKTAIHANEKELLSSLFQPLENISEDSFTISQQKWYTFLFSEEMGQSPLPTENTSVRFYYFFLKQPIDDKQNFEEAVKGIINSELVIWLSFSHGIIVEDKPQVTLEIDMLKDFSDTLTTDFYVEPFIYVGQLQKNDEDLKKKFLLEQSCFHTLHRTSNREKVMSFYEVLPILIMKAPTASKKDILSNHLLEAIEDKELHHTIEAFFHSNLNASSTAKRLFIHRNSLQYRLEKLLEKTGLDIRTFSNAAFIFLASILVHYEN
ncbi:PucR family transcriptional regulator [Metabacillus halosaccharovorans]|uniref:Helix-turn-helix domain-containing protein n=1 Tax=Metabacillus halosaccharovorans TaxID=930124 RepID=A0ABT3DJW7_9BACI|nr:helix-turn-helix domain-containing protein [Metabacillus halosaccharovorans]MCV9887206.1 helix-turn-helix domain-containing protein [Metabacillus halosaccharovorans]